MSTQYFILIKCLSCLFVCMSLGFIARGGGMGGLAAPSAMVTMGGDLQPGCLDDRLLTGLGQPQINP